MKNCNTCHFLTKSYRDLQTGGDFSFSLSVQEREEMKTNQRSISDNYSLNCRMGVWDEGVTPGKENRDAIINKTKRDNFCFYFPHHEGMLFKAAVELQQREQENFQLKSSNFYTQLGLWLAGIGLLASAIIGIIQIYHH